MGVCLDVGLKNFCLGYIALLYLFNSIISWMWVWKVQFNKDPVIELDFDLEFQLGFCQNSLQKILLTMTPIKGKSKAQYNPLPLAFETKVGNSFCKS